jgi:hypothetical protein
MVAPTGPGPGGDDTIAVMSTLEQWWAEVVTELGIGELGDLVDQEFAQPLVLDLTKDVAHGVARPAAPLTAYLLGLAAGRAAGAGPPEPELLAHRAAHLAALARGEEPDAP